MCELIKQFDSKNIKFNAWDKQKNKMIKNLDPKLLHMSYLIPLRWTETLDRNKVELYEADIVKHKDFIGYIIQSHGGWCIKTKDAYIPLPTIVTYIYIEKLGNLFENKNLILKEN